jgi:uncharacterized protein
MNLENCILTYSGRYVNLLKPDPVSISITDIAHALSQINRFGGHTRRFYSVAQHCVLTSRLVPLQYRLHALLHDAAEAYFGDMVQPLKRLDGNAQYRAWESMMQAEIFDRFSLGMQQSPECKACLHEADLIMLATERRDLMHPDTAPWPILDGIKPQVANINPVSSHLAESMFLTRFKELAGVL